MVEQALKKDTVEDDGGIPEAFTFLEEFNECINSGLWISNECFVFTNNKGSISYLITNKLLKLTSCDKKYFIIGYDAKQSRLYLVDKSLNMVSYSLQLALVNYQNAILNEDLHGASVYFKDIPEVFHSKIAKFLESQDQKELAF